MTAIYIIFSLLLTEDPLLVVIKNSGLSFLKIGLVVMVMSIYVGLINPDRLINALRSIWVSLNLPWKFVENGFLFIELIFRFYPTMKLEWERITNSRKILHIDRVRTRLERVKQYADDIPGLIVYAFQKSEETAEIMEMRGYGRNFPRGLANPIPFRMVDFLLIILISIIFIGLNNYVQV